MSSPNQQFHSLPSRIHQSKSRSISSSQSSSPASASASNSNPSKRTHSRASSLFSYPRSFWSSSDSEPASKTSLNDQKSVSHAESFSALGLDLEAELGQQEEALEWADGESDQSSNDIKPIKKKTRSSSTSNHIMYFSSNSSGTASPSIPFPTRESSTSSSPLISSDSSHPGFGSPSSLFSKNFSETQTSPTTSIGNSPQSGNLPSVTSGIKVEHSRSNPTYHRSSHSFNEGKISPTRQHFRSSISSSNPRHEKGGLKSFSSLRNLASSAAIAAVAWSSPRLTPSATPSTSASDEEDSGGNFEAGTEGGGEDSTETEESHWRRLQRHSSHSKSNSTSTLLQSTSQSVGSIKISRKRLDKAVSAALEAGQVLEEEEIAREKAKLRRKEKANLQELKRQREISLREQLRRIRSERDSRRGLGIEMGEESGSQFPSMLAVEDDRTQDSLERELELSLATLSSDSETYDDEDQDQDPTLALDLYISSLSHLLNALTTSSSNSSSSAHSLNPISKERISPTSRALSLFSSSTSPSTQEIAEASDLRRRTTSEPSRIASSLPDRQRLELKLQLEEALKKLGYDPSKQTGQSTSQSSSNPSEVEVGSTFTFEDGRQERIVHHHHHYMPYHLVNPSSNDQDRSWKNVTSNSTSASSSSEKRQRTLSGFLASTTLDMSLTLAASAIAAANQGLRSLTPALVRENQSTQIKEMEPQEIESGNVNQKNYASTPFSGYNNLDLSFKLLGGAVTALLSGIGSSASQDTKTTSEVSKDSNQISTFNPSSTQEEEEDQISEVLINLARSLKRSPLPTHVSQLFSTSFHLLKTIDRRYSLRDRTLNLTVQNSKKTYDYIDKNELHVRAVRGIWKGFQIAGKVWRAYDEEIAWNEGMEKDNRIKNL